MYKQRIRGFFYRLKWRGNRNYKDRLFRFLFTNDKVALLQLYNAINGTDYDDPEKLIINTIQDVVYMGMKNDLSFLIGSTLNLYEHQSTFNANMPLRELLYLAQLYQQYIEENGYNIYGSRQIKLPVPQCIVFYNGTDEQPDEQILRLSDAFEPSDKIGCAELSVRVLNINLSHNRRLMEQCQKLEDYAVYVARIWNYLNSGYPLNDAIDRATDECISEGILDDVLRRHRAEVTNMLLTEFDAKAYEKTIREESYEAGQQVGQEQFAKLTRILIASNRIADLQRAIDDVTYRETLYLELGIK